MTERWLPVVGLEGRYSVSDEGRVRAEWRRTPAGAKVVGPWLLKTSLGDRRYRVVGLNFDGKHKSFKVHILVMQAFVGPRPDGMVVAHNDGDTANAALLNLRYDTQSGNMLDMHKHGTLNPPRGERHGCAKLTEQQIASIRSDTRSQRAIAADFGISQVHVGRLKRNVCWAIDGVSGSKRVEQRPMTCLRPVEQIGMDGVVIQTHASIAAAANAGFLPSSIIRVCKGRRRSHGGYQWRYAPIEPVKVESGGRIWSLGAQPKNTAFKARETAA